MRFRSWSLPLVIAVITECSLKKEYRIYTHGLHNPCVDSGKFNFFLVFFCLFHEKKLLSRPVSNIQVVRMALCCETFRALFLRLLHRFFIKFSKTVWRIRKCDQCFFSARRWDSTSVKTWKIYWWKNFARSVEMSLANYILAITDLDQSG